MEFTKFKKAVEKQFKYMTDNFNLLYLTDVDRNLIWETYLKSFPEGTNNIYKERPEYDCVHCRQFLKPYANVVAIDDNLNLISIWDIEKTDIPEYDIVAKKLSEFVKSAPIKDVFFNSFAKLGVDKNVQIIDAEKDQKIVWEHFYYRLPNKFVKMDVAIIKGKYRDKNQVFQRGLKELTVESIQTVFELILAKHLERGGERKKELEAFLKYKQEYDKLSDEKQRNYTWKIIDKVPDPIAKLWKSAIGTLMLDISEGRDILKSVISYNSKTNPNNYKRPKSVYTKKDVERAKQRLSELGLLESIERRFATVDDVNINNVLFKNKVKPNLDVFDDLLDKAKEKINIKGAIETSIDKFISDVLPSATALKILFEERLQNNLVSLITSKNINTPSLFKWDNPFSWTYNNNVTDSIKERVKKAGGKVDGIIRISLSWFNIDDYDLHVIEPDGSHIYFSNKHNHKTTGQLDVDMNASSTTTKPVENITWSVKSKMLNGKYRVYVNNYNNRVNKDYGFIVELEYNGKVKTYKYDKFIRQNKNVDVVIFEFDKNKDDLKIIKSLPEDSKTISKEIWNIDTNKFHEVELFTLSPNYWKGKEIGNKHYFFFLKNCKNPDTPRGFFNEFLKDELLEQKRFFEVLGDKMKVEKSENQLSGLGFSFNKENYVYAQVEMSKIRKTFKIIF